MGSQFLESLTMCGCVLANIERRKMKPESPHFAQQRIEHSRGQDFGAIFFEAPIDQTKVPFKLLSRRIRVFCLSFTSIAQLNDQIAEEPAIEFGNRDSPAPRRLLAHAACIFAQARVELCRNC